MDLNLREKYWPKADEQDRLRIAAARALSAFCILGALAGAAVTALNLQYLPDFAGQIALGGGVALICAAGPILINGSSRFYLRSRVLGYGVLALLAGLSLWDGDLYNPANFLLIPSVMTFTLVLGLRDGAAAMAIALGAILITGVMGWGDDAQATEAAEYGALAAAAVFAFAGAIVFRREMRSALEALSAQKRVADRANRAKSQFLASMSHELRTPLNGVIGMATVLEHSELTAEQSRAVRIVGDSAGELNQMISRILEFARLDSGALELARAPFTLGALGDEVRERHEAAARTGGLAFSVAFDPAAAPDARWLGDAERIGQILDNLVANAIRFTPKGEVNVVLSTAGDRLRFDVVDTGPGVPENRREAIFEPFTQADGTATRRHGGAGLGLSMAARLAEAMGGILTLESTPGKGCIFRLELPAEPAKQG